MHSAELSAHQIIRLYLSRAVRGRGRLIESHLHARQALSAGFIRVSWCCSIELRHRSLCPQNVSNFRIEA